MDDYFCYVCLHDHRTGSEVFRDHRRYSTDGGAATDGLTTHLEAFYLQTKGIAAALKILGFDEVRIHPPRFGEGWPPLREIEARYRGLAKANHPDASGDARAFHRVQWAMAVIRRYRPPQPGD